MPQAGLSTFSGFAITGDSDVSPDNTASQFLLLRGLEPGVTEELVAKGVAKLYKARGSPPPDAAVQKKTKIVSTSSDIGLGAKEGSLRRVLLVRDRKSNDSWRYAFAEFASVEDAQAAMLKYNAADKFTISSKPVMVSYIHAGVFVPMLDFAAASTKFTFSPLSNPATKLMYWDESAYVSELMTVQDPPIDASRERQNADAKLAAMAANEGLVDPGREGEVKSKKRKAEKETSSSKKVVAPHLQFWSNRHAELHGIPAKDLNAPTETPNDISKAESDSLPETESFVDLKRNCCLLCSRQFKTGSEVNKHVRVSKLHQDNLLIPELKSQALAKLNKSKPINNDAQSEADASAYRDRARERRQAFNQPKQPAAQHGKPKDSNVAMPPKEEPVAPAPSKGAALLGKMGWSAGEGLGAQGTGMKDAIRTEIYTQGVGLGAEGGKLGDAVKEAERNTKGGYGDFVDKTRDRAKERFEALK